MKLRALALGALLGLAVLGFALAVPVSRAAGGEGPPGSRAASNASGAGAAVASRPPAVAAADTSREGRAVAVGAARTGTEAPVRAANVRLFTIKFRDPSDVARLIGDLLSERGSVTTQPKLRTVIVQDTPDILDKIQVLIGSYDVPPRSVEFTVTLILASLAEEGREERPSISTEVRGIADALPDITRWTNYKTLDSVKIAGSEGSRTSRDLAEAYRVEFNLESVSESRGIIRLNPFSLQKAERDAAGAVTYRSVYTTTVNLKNDKLLTIGATKSETSPRALFLAIRARIEAP